jgi:hypothetical protein
VRKTVVAPCEYAVTDDGATFISCADAVAESASKNVMIANTFFMITLIGSQVSEYILVTRNWLPEPISTQHPF